MPPEDLREKLEEAFDDEPAEREEAEPVEEVVAEAEEPVGDQTEDKPEPEPEGEPEAGEAEGEQEEKEEPVATHRPPPGWKPAMREKFKALPEDVQGEILRREVDIHKGMELASEARKFKHEFDQKVAPYQAELASRNVSAMDAFDNYLGTAYALRHAPPGEKAALVGGLIQQYGIDIGELDKVLTSQIEGNNWAPGVDPVIAQTIEKTLAPYKQFMETQQQSVAQSHEALKTEVRSEIDAFKADPVNEFYEDVKDDMAVLLETAARRNVNMTLQQAYDRATLLQPEIADLVAQRRLQQSAQSKDAAAKAAKAKALGVSGSSPEMGQRAPAQSLRGAIEAAFNEDA